SEVVAKCDGDRSIMIGVIGFWSLAACEVNRCASEERLLGTGSSGNIPAAATPSKQSAAKVTAALSARTATAANDWIAGRIGVAGIETRPTPAAARPRAPVVESIAALADCIALPAEADILADIDALLTSR